MLYSAISLEKQNERMPLTKDVIQIQKMIVLRSTFSPSWDLARFLGKCPINLPVQYLYLNKFVY